MPYNPHTRRFALSDRVQLGLGSLAVVTYVGLLGCEGTPPKFEDAIFTSVTECVRAGFPDPLCEGSYNAAWSNYLTSAPQFSSQTNCEAEWGAWQCMERDAAPTALSGPSTGSVFVPLLAGFAVTQALQRRYYENEDDESAYRGGGGVRYGSPFYRTRTGSAVQITPSGTVGARPVIRPVNVNTVTVARGGFGSSGRSRGFGG